MSETILFASTVLLWIMVLTTLMLLFGLMKIVGGLSITVTNSRVTNLRGIDIGYEIVHNELSNQDESITAILSDRPMLLILTEPSCAHCERLVAKLLQDLEGLTDRIMVAVRGGKKVAKVVGHDLRAYACAAVFEEHPGLKLTAFAAPFAAVLNSAGGYVASREITENTDSSEVFGMLTGFEAAEATNRAVLVKM